MKYSIITLKLAEKALQYGPELLIILSLTGSHLLAQVKEKTAWDILHGDIHQIVDVTAGWLDDLAGVTVA